MTPEEADQPENTKIDQYMTHINTIVVRLEGILTKKYRVEGPTDSMAMHAHLTVGPAPTADSSTMQLAVLSLT